MNKVDLCNIASETVDISEKGKYLKNGKTVQLYATALSVLYKDGVSNLNGLCLKEHNSVIEVTNEGTVDALIRLNSKLTVENRLGILNFASAYNPGGGFLGGAMAQEECIAYCSDLYYKQTEEKAFEYYEMNRQNKSKMYLDAMIFSDVNFFRNGYFDLLDNVIIASVLTSPAINMSAIKQNKEPLSIAKTVMKNRMRKILEVFIENGCDYIILGAFGCGVFGNDPVDIAKYWYDLLFSENYSQYFKHICFAILDGRGPVSNLNVFKNQFKDEE